MEESKKWYTSKTVWGSVVAVIAMALGYWDITITEAIEKELVDLILQVIEVGGVAVALYGRIVADKKLEA